MYMNLPLGDRRDAKPTSLLGQHWTTNGISGRGPQQGRIEEPRGIESRERRVAGPRLWVKCRHSADQRRARSGGDAPHHAGIGATDVGIGDAYGEELIGSVERLYRNIRGACGDGAPGRRLEDSIRLAGAFSRPG